MSKLVSFFVSLLIVLETLSLSASLVHAAPSCSGSVVQTNPVELLDTNREAKFTINIGNNQDFSEYWVQLCTPNNIKATRIDSSNISVDLKTNPPPGTSPCEFDVGTHQITVKALVHNQLIDQCVSSYTVKASNAQCKLDIQPTNGITSSTNLTVSGTDLTEGGRFLLFFDDDAIDIPNNAAGRALIDIPNIGLVPTPTFTSKSIPQQLMIPGNHIISLRERANTQGWFNPTKQEKDFFGPPFCPRLFSVGTPSSPGSVAPLGVGPTKVCKPGDKNCTVGGGDPCDEFTGIKTAIGCIHTNPAEFAKDFMNFAIGIGGGLAFLMMLLGAFQMLTSNGNPDTLKAGQDRLTSAVIGLLFVIFAVLLLQLIGAGILALPEFK